MLNSQKIGFERYENWSWLIYAVAMVDKGIHSKEVDKLRSFTEILVGSRCRAGADSAFSNDSDFN